MDLADAYAHTGAVMVENMLWRDTEEGIAAFLDRRPPAWQGAGATRGGARTAARRLTSAAASPISPHPGRNAAAGDAISPRNPPGALSGAPGDRPNARKGAVGRGR